MAINKRQHFVPQHYLRQFSVAGSKQIVAAKVQPFQYIGLASISGQCQHSYMYKEDGVLDEIFTSIERDLAPVLAKVANGSIFDSKDLAALKFLAVILHVRTKKSIKIAKLFPRRWGYEIIKSAIARGELPPPKGGWEEQMMDFTGVAGNLMKTSAIPCWLEMHTLCCKILTAEKNTWFITSDNPVITMNQLLAAEDPKRSFVGFGRSGFQLLLPIAPKFCLFFYDPNVYKVGGKRQSGVTLSAQDVNLVNSLQVQSADNCVYFHRTDLRTTIGNLAANYASLRRPIEDSLRDIPGGSDNERLLHFRQPTFRLRHPWNFCTRLKRIELEADKMRDPAWSTFVQKVSVDMACNQGRTVFESMEKLLGRRVAQPGHLLTQDYYDSLFLISDFQY